MASPKPWIWISIGFQNKLGMGDKPRKFCLNQMPECQATEFGIYRRSEELLAFSLLRCLCMPQQNVDSSYLSEY